MTEIRWWETTVTLIWRAARAHQAPGETLGAFFGLFRSVQPQLDVKLAYHLHAGSLWKLGLVAHQQLQLRVVIGAANEAMVREWCAAFSAHVAGPTSGVELAQPPSPPVLRCMTVEADAATDEGGQEISLLFLTPLPFIRKPGADRTTLDPQELRALLNRRLHAWFGIAQALAPAPLLRLNCAFWRYNEHQRTSKSQRQRALANGGIGGADGTDEQAAQYLKGCRGPLLLRGVPPQWLAWLRVLEQIHAGGPLAIGGMGQFVMQAPAPALLDKQLGNLGEMTGVVEDIMRTHDAEPPVDVQTGQVWLAHELAVQIAQKLSLGTYEPEPTERYLVPKESGGERAVERLAIADLAAQRRMLLLAGPLFDATLSPASFGYRKHRSREDALAALRSAMARGMRYAVRADIEDFFPSIQHAQLDLRLDEVLPRSDSVTRELLRRFVRAPWRDAQTGEVHARSSGLAQGAPLSPMLANIYLDGFDRAIQAQGLDLVRFGDDFVILARTQAEAEQALDRVRQLLAPEGLRLSPAKTAVLRVDEGFDFLGERVDGRTGAGPVAALAAQRKPVIVTEPYVSLGVNGDALDVRRQGRVIGTVPLRRMSELVTLAPVSISSALIERCARFRIPVAVALPAGYQMACLAPDSREFMRTAHQQALRFDQAGQTARAAVAAEFVAAKLDNYAAWIRGNYQAGDAGLLNNLAHHRDRARAGADVAGMRGHEGLAARDCFAWLRSRIRDDQALAFASRRRERGAPDRLNSMLNFGYYLLYNRLNGLVRTHGLNPYLGYLHDGQDDYETLVADVQEVFRVHVDRTVLRLINRRETTSAHFGDGEGNFRLNREGVHRLAAALESTLNQRMDGVALADLMVAQVRALRAFATEGAPLWLHRWRHGQGAGPSAPLGQSSGSGDGEDA